jgi:endonuclease YncB( thermonuclease family)
VQAGMAWHYKEYELEQSPADRELYARAEDDARAARRGLWQDADPVEPSAFRKAEKREGRDAR